MDKSKIEREAVFSVSSYINRCPGLVPYINYNDKTPMWDGSIFIYNDDKIKNDNFYGIVDVQIKGTEAKHTKEEDIDKGTEVKPTEEDKPQKYYIKKSNLNAYEKEGGVLFFLVIVDVHDYNANKIYYKFLDTKTLDDLKKMDQDKPPIKLDPIQKYSEFSNIIRDFYDSTPSSLSSSIKIFTKQMLDNPKIIKLESDYFTALNTVINKLKNISGKGIPPEKVETILKEALEAFDILDIKCDYPEYKLIRAKILSDLAGLHNNQNNFEQSLIEINESVQIIQDLAKTDPDRYNENLAKGMSNYAEILEKAGNMKEAKKSIEKAKKLFEDLREKYQKHVDESDNILNRISYVH